MPVCRTLFFSFVLFLSRGLSAQNLVPNPSFSDINICTEYASPCEPAAWWRVAPHVRRASPIFNPSGAGSGESYIQLESGMMAQQRREYMQTRLLAPMKPGKKYLITVYAGSRDDAAPGIDLLFAEHDVYAMFVQRLDYTPTIELRKAQQIKFNKPWHVYQLEYIPDKRYTNLILGDFSPSRVPRNHEESGPKYLCVDSICVEPIEAKEKLDPAMVRNVYNEHHRHTLPDAFLRDHGLDLVRMVPTAPTDTSAWRKWQDLSQKLHSRGGRVTIDPKMRELLQNGSSHCDTLIIGSGIFINNGAGLNTDFGFVLDSALQYYESGRSGKIKVIGHVNQPGTDRFNELLSVDRAKEVVKHLYTAPGLVTMILK
ncbi:hypothetical protein MKQ70_26360 [Chitinophaga sedimenti]|uniref:hypothetical protein n=1 Tax=Chitinophaga sedimenti TaxID=2033606 RepID=UPI002003D563|nr:hypothetical protein [Chitinophaga sedimenti]MCK7558334.1 hypothetical protein [Chitinophaga sedimenti]